MSKMKEIMAENRAQTMADKIRAVASTSPVKDVRNNEIKKPIVEKQEKTKLSKQPYKGSASKVNNELENRLIDYKLEGATSRITYIISERNIGVLKVLKSRTGVPVTDIINFLLEEAILSNKKEIDNLITEHIKNLKL